MEQISIPGYRMEKELGRGGMATVYLAEQESLNRKVAIKVMAPALAADPSFGERFLKEARTVARLTHPNILAIFDVGASGHYHYMAMEYVAGGDLKEKIRVGLTAMEALAVMKQMAAALDHAHRQGYVHRDIKPDNILFRKDGSIVLTDFGIAKAVGSNKHMTRTGMSIGTPHYMSPEQARGQQVDGRSDLYSLGVVFYEMLTGQVPYDANDTFAVGLMHINDPVPELPGKFSRCQPLIERLLAKDPSDRLDDAAALLTFIEKLATERAAPQPVSPPPARSATGPTATVVKPAVKQSSPLESSYKTPPPTRSHGLRWAAGGAVVALLAGILVFVAVQRRDAPPALGGGGTAVKTIVPKPALPTKPVVGPGSTEVLKAGAETKAPASPVPAVPATRPEGVENVTEPAVNTAANKAPETKASRPAPAPPEAVIPADIQVKLDSAGQMRKSGKSGDLIAAAAIYETLLLHDQDLVKAKARDGIQAVVATGSQLIQSGELRSARAVFQSLKESAWEVARKEAVAHLYNVGERYKRLGKAKLAGDDCTAAKNLLTQARQLLPDDKEVDRLLNEARFAKGTLIIFCQPWAYVKVDGQKLLDQNRKQIVAPAENIQLPCGPHAIDLINDQDVKFKRRSTQVEIRRGKTTKLIVIQDNVRTTID